MKSFSAVVALAICLALQLSQANAYFNTASVDPNAIWGACYLFAAHGATTVTFDGPLTNLFTGDVGVSPGTSITGMHPYCYVYGVISSLICLLVCLFVIFCMRCVVRICLDFIVAVPHFLPILLLFYCSSREKKKYDQMTKYFQELHVQY